MEHCSFCGNSAERARVLVAGPQRVYICDQCVVLCQKTIDEANAAHRRQSVDAGPVDREKALASVMTDLARVMGIAKTAHDALFDLDLPDGERHSLQSDLDGIAKAVEEARDRLGDLSTRLPRHHGA